MDLLFPFLIFILFLLFRSFRYSKRRVSITASIEKIKICTMGEEIIIPEVEVFYKYYYQEGIYYGKGYMLFSDLMDFKDYSIHFDQQKNPILVLPEYNIVSEEHIEAYILQRNSELTIFIDPEEPYRSTIEKVYSIDRSVESQKKLFE